MKKIFTAATSAALVIALLISGCNTEKPDTSPYFFAMAANAVMNIPSAVQSEREEDCYKIYGATRKVLAEIDESLSSTLKSSCVYKFNQAPAGAKVEIDETAYKVFGLAKSVYEITEGFYNPAVYYNVIAYGFGGAMSYPDTAEELPKDGDIAKYNELAAAFKDLTLVVENGKYYAVKPGVEVTVNGEVCSMKVDLGGLGKGYAVDTVNSIMDGYNMPYGYFSFGESSIAFKKYKSVDSQSENYILGLSNPRYKKDSSRQYVEFDVMDSTLSTSGDNVQYYEIDGVRYSHVIDPKTGKPVQTGVMSATVGGPNAARNDAYTTAIMAMGKTKAVEFINTHLSDLRVVFTYNNGGKYEIISNIPKDKLRIKAQDFYLANTVEDGKIVLVP